MNITEKFKGTGVAVVTPFRPDGNIDLPALTRIVNHIIAGGCNYIVALGTTGESVTLTADEKKMVKACIVESTAGRVPLMLGVGGNNTASLVHQLTTENMEGFDAVLSVSPYYNKPNQEGLYRHYSALADASPKPVLLYNVPGRTGMNMTAETTLRLASHGHIFGIKEASGNFDQCMEIIKNKPRNFMVISGDDAYTLPFIALGMDGVISVVANAYPHLFSSMVKKALDGAFASAQIMHYELTDTIKLMFSDGSPGGVKAYLKLLQLCDDGVRLPLAPVNTQIQAKIINDFERLQKQA